MHIAFHKRADGMVLDVNHGLDSCMWACSAVRTVWWRYFIGRLVVPSERTFVQHQQKPWGKSTGKSAGSVGRSVGRSTSAPSGSRVTRTSCEASVFGGRSYNLS